MDAQNMVDLGELIDKLDNYAHALKLPMPAEFHVKVLRESLPELVKEFKQSYAAALGENPWEDEPEE